MKQSILLLLLLLISGFLKAQVIPMDNGTGLTVDCAAADTGGQIYTLRYTYADTCIMQRWSPSTKQWTTLPSVKKMLNPQFLIPDCHFLSNNRMVVAGVNDTGKFAIYTVNGSTWNRIGVFLDNNLVNAKWENVRLYQFKNVVYLVTTIDSVIGYPKSKVYQVNSNGLVSMGFNVESPEYHLAMKGDTLVVSANNSIYFYSAGNWSRYYTSPYKVSNTIRGMTGHGTYLYVTEGQSTISKIYGGTKIDSVTTNFDRPVLNTWGNRILISERAGDRSESALWSFTNMKLLEINARLGLVDSIASRFVFAKNKVYFYKERDILFNKVNCHGIAELDVNKLQMQGRDTLLVRAYLDHNRNNKKDQGDTPLRLYVPSMYGDAAILTDAVSGEAIYYPLDNQDICFRPVDGIKLDSCYSLQYSAGICGKTFLSVRNRDTIDFAYNAKTNGYKNIKIRSFPSGPRRIDSEFTSQFVVYREDCNTTTISNVSFYIDLAEKTELLNSSPAYSSRTGNRLYYQLNLPSAGAVTVSLKMKYPFADFKLNERVCHKVFIGSIAGEDTMGNRDSIVHRCTYSYDPNMKYCLPEGKVFSSLKKVRYHIEFQNEGNDYAYRVRVVDTLNVKIPVYEFRMHAASHDYKVSSNGNVLTWTFEDIMLAPKSLSEEGSKGYLEFDANISSDIRVGDSIYNNAMIYFDLNEPIRTKNATIIRASRDIGLTEIGSGQIRLYPNPASTYIYVDQLGEGRYSIYNSIGQLMGEYKIGEKAVKIDIRQFTAGIYIIRGEKGETYRFVVE
ncbi:MAG: T9SS type A sorting domain-containing protein [Chitinophagaceae bacterium]